MDTSKVAKIVRLVRLVKSAGCSVLFGAVVSEIGRRIYSDETCYGQFFDLTVDVRQPVSPIPLSMRLLSDMDLSWLFYDGIATADRKELRRRIEGLMLVNSGIPWCYVAVDKDDIPCAMCWLILADENERIRSYFGGGLPVLRKHELLLELVYTSPDYRGKRLMEWITLSLFREAAALGATRAISFVNSHNEPSQRGSERIKWQWYLTKRVSWRLFRRQITFEPWNERTEDEMGVKWGWR